MLTRYRKSNTGEVLATGRIYLAREHGIARASIDRDAVAIIERLARAGYEAYVVGGALRDVLCGERPKDVDIATDARPGQVTALFQRSRVIGRRFRLVHVPVFRRRNGGSARHVYEVATFRGADRAHANQYGTLDQDAQRRDFTINALYYSPISQRLIDYVDGLQHLRDGVLQAIGDAEASFTEDPVRMLRAVKYTAGTRIELPAAYRKLIKRGSSRLAACSVSRLTEEMSKILASGRALPILSVAHELRLLAVMIPAVARLVRGPLASSATGRRLGELDADVAAGRLPPRQQRLCMFRALAAELPATDSSWRQDERPEKRLAQVLRRGFEPLVLPQQDALTIAEEVASAFTANASADADDR